MAKTKENIENIENIINIEEELNVIEKLEQHEYNPIKWTKNLTFFGTFVKFNKKRFIQKGNEVNQTRSIDLIGSLSTNKNIIKIRISTFNFKFLQQLLKLEIEENPTTLICIKCIGFDSKNFPNFVVRAKINGIWLTSNQYLTEKEKYGSE